MLRNSKDKRARKLAKKRVRPGSTPKTLLQSPSKSLTLLSQLGTFGRAKKKVDELQRVIAESRRTGH